MTWILMLTGVGLVLAGAGVVEMCWATDEPEPHRLITVMRHDGRLLVGMRRDGESWIYVVPICEAARLFGLLTADAACPELSLTGDDALAIVRSVKQYALACWSVVEQLQSQE